MHFLIIFLMQRISKLTLGAVLAALLTAAGCQREAARPAVERHDAAVPVTVASVTNAAWEKSVSIIGTLFPKDEATLGAQVEGTVERTDVDFGDRIRDHQELASIDTASYEAQSEQTVGNLAKAEASLANARKNFARVADLKKGGVASESDYDQAKAQLDQGEAEVKAARGTEMVARLNVQRSRVLAPFDGAVSQRIVGRGDFVRIGSPLFVVVNDAVLKFIFQVPERHASLVQKGLVVRFGVDNYPNELFAGSVYLISPAVLTSSRAFNVGALVTNTDFRLKANTFARGSLVLEPAAPTLVVPLEAVVSFAGVTKVFVVEKGNARDRPVTAGRIRDGVQEIIEGLKVGDLVVVSGQSHLSDGVSVAVQSLEAPGVSARAAPVKSHSSNAVAHETH